MERAGKLLSLPGQGGEPAHGGAGGAGVGVRAAGWTGAAGAGKSHKGRANRKGEEQVKAPEGEKSFCLMRRR